MRGDLVALKLLLDEFGGFSIESLDDRVRLQKAIYLIQLTGIDLGHRFTWNVCGPYSTELATAACEVERELPIFYPHPEEFSKDHWLKDSARERLEPIRRLLGCRPVRRPTGMRRWRRSTSCATLSVSPVPTPKNRPTRNRSEGRSRGSTSASGPTNNICRCRSHLVHHRTIGAFEAISILYKRRPKMIDELVVLVDSPATTDVMSLFPISPDRGKVPTWGLPGSLPHHPIDKTATLCYPNQ